MRHIGFTGTRKGMTEEQRLALVDLFYSIDLLRTLDPYTGHYRNEMYFHHGDCKGSDVTAHALARSVGWLVISHPPENSGHRAWCTGSYQVRSAAPYLTRNLNIVNESDLLIATPLESEMITRSGTWTTIRRAYDRGLHTKIIFPDGRTEDFMSGYDLHKR